MKSHKIHPLTVLWQSLLFCIQELPIDHIPCILHPCEYRVQERLKFTLQNTLHIFKDKVFWLLLFKHPQKILNKNCAAIAQLLLPCNGNILTREASSEQVKVWKVCNVNLGNITKIVMLTKVFCEGLHCKLVNFGKPNKVEIFSTNCILQSKLKSSNPCEGWKYLKHKILRSKNKNYLGACLSISSMIEFGTGSHKSAFIGYEPIVLLIDYSCDITCLKVLILTYLSRLLEYLLCLDRISRYILERLCTCRETFLFPFAMFW